MVRSPYIVGPPVRQLTDFFGRERQTRQFYETLDGAQVQCVSVLGLRRAGKTSFLQHIAHPRVMAANLSAPERYVFVYIDITACRTPADFYASVCQRLLAALPNRTPERGSRLTADVFTLESLLYEFGGRRVVLVLDEFDHLKTADFGGDFLVELRALAGVWDYELAYVTSSYWELNRIGRFIGLPATSPFYNIFYPTPIHLSGLDTVELERLVREPALRVGVQADEEDVAFVRYYAGSIPFFVQALAAVRLAHKSRNRPLDVRAVTQRLVAEMWPYFEQWWGGLSDVERAVLLAVAQEKPIGRLPYDEREVATAVRRLTDYGMLNRTGDQVWADSRLFSQWLLEYTGERPAGVKSLSTIPVITGAAQPSLGGYPHQGTAESLLKQLVETRQVAPNTICASGGVVLREYFLSLVKNVSGAAVETLGAGHSAFLIGPDHSPGILVECGLWLGQKALLKMVDQLLAHRQAEAGELALFIAVKPAELSLVFDALRQAVPYHAAYAGEGARTEKRHATFQFFALGNPRRLVNLSVLLFPLAG
jgi:hypothetical protein